MGVNRGIMHCFGSDLKMARECLNLGLYLAFGGVITFKNALELQEVVKEVPLERIPGDRCSLFDSSSPPGET